jgi:signal transduction histidine kinase
MNQEHDALFKWMDFVLAALTIGCIAGLLLYLWFTSVSSPALIQPTLPWVFVAVALFTLNWLANLHLRLPHIKRRADMPASLVLAAVSAILLMLMFAPGVCAILWLLVVGQMPRYLSLRTSALAAIVIPLLIGGYHWLGFGDPYAMINVGLYTLFNLFVLYLSVTLESEKQARAQASRLVAELTATQELLASTSKRDERLRIARELHDLSGHHLAALSLQLEIARHTEGAQHDGALQRAGVIAHLLLSELRDTVSTFREHRGLDIRTALHTLVRSWPRPQVWLQIDPKLRPDDVRLAETLLRCVQEAMTNMVRHSHASRAAINIKLVENRVQMTLIDNGGCKQLPCPGNGLKGMQERIEALQGSLTMSLTGSGLQLCIELPLDNGLVV